MLRLAHPSAELSAHALDLSLTHRTFRSKLPLSLPFPTPATSCPTPARPAGPPQPRHRPDSSPPLRPPPPPPPPQQPHRRQDRRRDHPRWRRRHAPLPSHQVTRKARRADRRRVPPHRRPHVQLHQLRHQQNLHPHAVQLHLPQPPSLPHLQPLWQRHGQRIRGGPCSHTDAR